MKQYMLVVLMDGEEFANFYDDYATACNSRMDAECGLGAYVELYARIEDEDYGTSYVLIE